MSVEIDPKNVDPKHYGYLRDRPWMMEEFRRQGFGDEMDAVKSGVKTRKDPAAHSRMTTDEMRLGTQPPQHPEAAPNGVTDGDDDDVDYNDWPVADLKAEIDARNKEEGRTEKLSSAGNKAALVGVLEADDIAEASA